MKKLEIFSTKELVEEVIKREGVESMVVDPHTEKEVKIEGPAIVIKVID
ncbi:BC1881 family protein [Caminicella sporogenes]|nr:BC1881 family protein [Caminicella sporogenes]WIF95053.1 BC1881 family protein [Caminicella sporogenes]